MNHLPYHRAFMFLCTAFLAAALASACAEGSLTPPEQDGECVEGLRQCNGNCVDTQTDPANCGECEAPCDAVSVCTDGACESCEGTLVACDGECVDFATDTRNCGQCGNVCGPEQTCANFMCACTDGKADCDGECVILASDHDHCGNCDKACADDEMCLNGICDTDCGDLKDCNGNCVDPLTDHDNCGFCNHFCLPSEDCINGICTCQPGLCGACGVTDLGSTVPQSTSGSTIGAPNLLLPGCGFGGAAERAYTFTAPDEGLYAFQVNGFFQPVISLRGATSCTEFACAADLDFVGVATVTAQLAANEQVLVVVEGVSGATGSYTLQVNVAPPCPSQVLGNTLPQVVSGNNSGVPDLIAPQCSFAGSGEVTYEFTAPTSDTYIFSVDTGFAFDPVIELLDGDCMGSPVACALFPATLVQPLAANQTVVIVVDGYFGSGPFTLTVDEAPGCPGEVLPSTVPQTVMGNSSDAIDQFTPYCLATFSPEDTYEFTAPAAGSYAVTVDTAGFFYPVIDVRNASCVGGELDCNYGATVESTQFNLASGQTAVIAVDSQGGAGPYTMTIDNAPPCPGIPLGSTLPATASGNTSGMPNLLGPTCEFYDGPEVTYSFTAPTTDLYAFTVESMFMNPAVEVRNASCNGASLGCGIDNIGGLASTTANLTAGQTVVIDVDSIYGSSGPYDLTVDVAPPCPEVDLGSTSPQTVMGTTSGSSFYSEPGFCSFGTESAPEASYAFTAPSNGSYTFDTLGSAFDTVLYVRTIDCGGAQLACNEDDFMSMTTQSKLQINLMTGQMVAIFIDAHFGDQGNYVLNIAGP